MNPEQIQKFNEMYQWFKDMQSSYTIPLTTDQAIRTRFFGAALDLTTSTKSATSENQSVNEAGAGSYSVLGIPDGYDERNDNGTVKYYPYFT